MAWLPGLWPRILLFVLVFLAVLPVPRDAYTVSHDYSSHATFEYYAANAFQFGRDVYQNVGPLGYVHYAHTYVGLLTARKLFFQVLLKLAFTALVLWAAGQLLGRAARGWWFLSFVLPAGILTARWHYAVYLFTTDIWAYLSVYLAALYLLQDHRDRRHVLAEAALVVMLSLLSLTKHTLLVLSCGVVLMVALRKARARDWTGGARLALYPVSLAGTWMLLGQDLAYFPGYALGVLRFLAGYNEAMSLVEPAAITLAGTAAIGLSAGASLVLGIRRDRARTAIEALLLYVTWKHAFVRADQHVIVFFGFLVYFGLIVLFGREPNPRGPGKRWLAYLFLLAISAAASIESLRIRGVEVGYSPRETVTSLIRSALWLARPEASTRPLEAELAQHRAAAALPGLRPQIGAARVDFFGWEPGYVLLNDLHYAPRPMPITFAAASEELMLRNADYYRDPRTAPEYVIAGYSPLDDRFLPQDDALALRVLLDGYAPVQAEQGLILLRRHSRTVIEPAPEEPLLRTRIGFGTSVSLREYGERVLWARVRIRHSWTGRMRSLLYKPPRCFIELTYDDGRPGEVFRFVTGIGPAGFLLSPAVRDNATLLVLYAEGPAGLRRPAAFRFSHDPGAFFEPEIDLEIAAIPGPKTRVRLPISP